MVLGSSHGSPTPLPRISRPAHSALSTSVRETTSLDNVSGDFLVRCSKYSITRHNQSVIAILRTYLEINLNPPSILGSCPRFYLRLKSTAGAFVKKIIGRERVNPSEPNRQNLSANYFTISKGRSSIEWLPLLLGDRSPKVSNVG